MAQFVFARDGGPLPWNDLCCGAALFKLSLLAYWRPVCKWALLATAAVAVWLLLFAYFGFDHPRPPRAQGDILASLVFLMVLLVPTEATSPPDAFRGPAIAAPF